MIKYIVSVIVVVTLFGGCAKLPVNESNTIEYYPLTLELINEHNLNTSDLLGLQMYTSKEIVLQDFTSSNASEVKGGVLVINHKKETNELIIQAHTPCTIIQSDENFIVVEFENNYKLTFARCGNYQGAYFLAAQKWYRGIGTLCIDGIEHKAIGTSSQSYLMINKKIFEINKPTSIVLKGKLI